MKIPEFNSLELTRTNASHTGKTELGVMQENSAKNALSKTSSSFSEYLLQALQTMNNQQADVSDLRQKVITEPDSVDLHDVTIAMSKARMSLNLAQSVIDRIVSGWSEITTTR